MAESDCQASATSVEFPCPQSLANLPMIERAKSPGRPWASITKGVANPRYLDLLAPSSRRAAAPSSLARRRLSAALIVITLTYSDVEPETPPARLQSELRSVLLFPLRSDRLLDQHLTPDAILDPARQPSDDTVVATENVAPFLTLVRVDPPVIEWVGDHTPPRPWTQIAQ